LAETAARIEIASGDLRLEGRVHDGGPRFGAVVLHPHPQYGGDMDNHVVVAICEAVAASGGTALRLNLRGTGRSEGAFDGGRGEAEDALAAVAVLRERLDAGSLMLAGYSFGAMVACAAAPRAAPDAMLLVSPPLAYGAMAPLPAGVPALALTGSDDPVSPPAEVQAIASAHVRTVVVPDVDHGWWGGAGALTREVAAFIAGLGWAGAA
jgi:alpha/beta superfamily hydrolase